MKKITVIAFLSLILTSFQVYAQFVTPLSSISGFAEVTDLQGETLSGKLRNASFGPNGIMSFRLIDKDGNPHKYKAADVKQLKIEVDGLAKLEIIAEQTSNISKLANSNFKEVVDRKHIYWQRVKQPGKEKYRLLQLLNPGFDSKLKVYDLPNAKSGETSVNNVAVSGNTANAYYVVKDGESYKVKKAKYKKEGYAFLFGNCDTMNDKKPDFKLFAAHVFYYDQFCK